MNQFLRTVSCLALLLSAGIIQANSSCRSNTATPYFSARSQSFDGARFLVGWTNFINLCDKDCMYGVFGVTLEGSKSFDSDALAECLFGKDVCNFGSPCCNTTSYCPTRGASTRSSNSLRSTKGGCCPSTPCCEQQCCFDCDSRSIVVSGSSSENRGKNDWLGDYFGLPSNHRSAIQVKPRVSNFLADFSLYVGLEEWTCLSGTFFWVRGPVVHSRWDLNLCEEVCCTDTCNAYPAGYYCQDELPCDKLLCQATDYLSNCRTPNTNCGDCSVCFEPLRNSKLAKCKLSETGFADLRFALGWNFLQCCDYHIGAALAVAAPTGTRPEGEYLFEPIIGNGKHWELGAYLTSHYTFWRSCDEDSSFGLYLDTYLMHMFRTRQRRSFDLCGRPNSRYMLAEKLGTPVEHLYTNENAGNQSGSSAPVAQFKSVFTPVANLTTFDVKVSSGIQANIVALFNYTNCGFTLDFGYEFWGRSCEKIDYDCDCLFPLAENTWALKGDAHVFGFAQITTDGVAQNDAIALSATQSRATIHTGLNALGNDAGLRQSRNPNVDNAQWARLVEGNTDGANILDRKTTNGGLQTKSSNAPQFISQCDIDLDGAQTRGISHAVFAHLSYAWRDCEDWIPYVGVGGKAEFGPRGDNCCDVGCNTNCAPTTCETVCNYDCDGCKKCNLSQWAVWVKGGIAFN